MEDKRGYINRVYRLAVLNGLCTSQKDFAELLKVNKTSLSTAMNGGKTLTESLTLKVQSFARLNGLEENPAQQAPPPAPDLVIPAATAELYRNMSETIRIQAEVIAKLQGGAMTYYAPKNFGLEAKK